MFLNVNQSEKKNIIENLIELTSIGYEISLRDESFSIISFMYDFGIDTDSIKLYFDVIVKKIEQNCIEIVDLFNNESINSLKNKSEFSLHIQKLAFLLNSFKITSSVFFDFYNTLYHKLDLVNRESAGDLSIGEEYLVFSLPRIRDKYNN